MTLGDLINELSKLPDAAFIEFDSGERPDYLASWRGVYRELTLVPAEPYWRETVGGLLKECNTALGGTFEGYKGGENTMTEHTPVWADAWGEYVGRAIVGIEPKDGVLSDTYVIKTWIIPDEYR